MNSVKKILKQVGRPVMNLLYDFLMLGAKRHGGRRLFDAGELKMLREALLTQNLFGMDGHMVASFEREYAQMYGVPYAVASTSGTAAIHTALGALDLDAGDEVITAPVTDLGTIIPILCQNLIPVFADVDETFSMDPEDVERKITPRTRAILVVHLFGNTCDMDRMVQIAKKHNIALIEDCAQAHWTEYRGKPVGTIGDIGCFSFQQSKHMTTGDGGMTITSNKAYYDRMKLFVDKGYARKGWGSRAYLFHAPNYRMNELTAAVGRVQLGKVKAVVEKRHAMGVELTRRLQGVPGIRPVPVTAGAHSSYWLFPFIYEGQDIEAFCKSMISRGVYAMAGYTGKTIYLCTESLSSKKTYGRSELPFSWRKDRSFEYKEGLCPKAEETLKRLVCVPWHEGWGQAGVEKADRVIRECLGRHSESAEGGRRISATQRSFGADAPQDDVNGAKPSRAASNKLKVAIIGCGAIGRWHLDAYKENPGVQVTAFVDTDLSRAKSFAAEVNARAYASVTDMLKNEKPDGASLCTIPSTHRDLAIELLEGGVHVLCEKPLAVSVKQAEEMLQKAREKKKLLLTAFKLRFFEEIVRAKEMIGKGSLGNILNFRLLFGGYMDMAGTWFVKKELSGGGVMMDNGPHALDLASFLFGEIKSVTGEFRDTQSVGVEDNAKLNLTLKSGVAGTVDLSWPTWVTPAAYLEIYGDEGAALLDMEGITYKFKTWTEWKRLGNKTGPKAAFARQIEHFVEAIRSGKTTMLDEEAGLWAQKWIEAAYRSAGK